MAYIRPALPARWRREIKRAREARGWGQSELAAACNLSASTVSRIERGTANPTISTVETIAECLGLDLAAVPRAPGVNRDEQRKRLAMTLARENLSAFAHLLDQILRAWVG